MSINQQPGQQSEDKGAELKHGRRYEAGDVPGSSRRRPDVRTVD